MPPLGWVTPVDYLEFDSDPAGNGSQFPTTETARPNLGLRQFKPFLKCLGQTANTVAGDAANNWVGTVAVPAIAVGVVGTATITNSLITANSFIFLSARKVGTDASTARGPIIWTDALAAGSATVGIRAQGVAIAVSTYVVHYWIVN